VLSDFPESRFSLFETRRLIMIRLGRFSTVGLLLLTLGVLPGRGEDPKPLSTEEFEKLHQMVKP
jgi:hypothetical protein